MTDDEAAHAGLIRSIVGEASKNFGTEFASAGTELGKTAAGIVTVAVSPFKAIIWGYSQIEEKLIPKIISKISNIKESERTLPDPNIVGSTLNSAQFSLHDENLTDLFANIISSSADINLHHQVHPAFVQIVQQLSPMDARGLSWIWKEYGHHHGKTPSNFPLASFGRKNETGVFIYIRDLSEMIFIEKSADYEIGPSENTSILDNAERLGLIKREFSQQLSSKSGEGTISPYEKILYHPNIIKYNNIIHSEGDQSVSVLGYGYFTQFGSDFFRVVVSPQLDRN